MRTMFLLLLQSHFSSAEWREKQQGRKPAGGKLEGLYFHCSVKDTISAGSRLQNCNAFRKPVEPVQRVRGETFQTMKGISDIYQLNVVRRGEYFWRNRPCWCVHCLKDVLEHPKNDPSQSYSTPGCMSAFHAPDMFRYHRQACVKITGRHIATPLPQQPETDWNAVAKKIVSGQWLFFASQDPEDKVPSHRNTQL